MKKASRLMITREVTPNQMSCIVGACPAIFETNQDAYAVIGKVVEPKELGLDKRVAKDETLIVVPKKLIDKKR